MTERAFSTFRRWPIGSTWRSAALSATMLAALVAPAVAAAEGAPASAAGAYLAANFAQDRNDAEAASRYLAIALDDDPGNVDLLYRAFTSAVIGGDMAAAVDLAGRLEENFPADPLSTVMLALDDVEAGRYDEAADRLESIERDGIASFLLPMLLGWVNAALDDEAAAMAELDLLAGENGFGALASLHRGLILDMNGDLEGARLAFEASFGLGHTLRLVEAAGSLYERLGETDRARSLYQQYAEENVDSTMVEPLLARIESGVTPSALITDPKSGIAEVLFHIATALNQEGAADIALLQTQFALYLQPDFPLAQVLLADILIGRGRNDEALAIYQAVDRRSAVSWTARLSVVTALDRLERRDEAIELLSTMAEERLDRSGPLVRLGDLLRGEERYDEAIVAYDAALERSPQLDDADWSFLYRHGIALERGKQWQRAEQALIRAIDLNPDHAHLLNYLGYSWIDRGENLDEGEELIRRAIDLSPQDGYIVDSLGWAYFRTGRIEEAVEELERAVELRSEDTVINDHLGDAYWLAGRRTEARYQWRRALRTVDDDEMALAIEDKLANGFSDAGPVDGPQTAEDASGAQ
ncbi:MAG: tetratricopeptide repeat protein [Alphaproteobacteria bacterium]